MALANTTSPGPMAEMNTTPLIDVMLVLLIMFIITIPVATHSIEIQTPAPSVAVPPIHLDPVVNTLTVTPGDRILWNGIGVSEAQLAALLGRTRIMKPEPELHFEPAATASYDLSSKVLNGIKASGVGNFGFIGNERYSEFGRPAD